jgi:hypothetical protein
VQVVQRTDLGQVELLPLLRREGGIAV